MTDHRKLDLRTLHFAGQEGTLIPALQKTQERDGYISPAGLRAISEEHGVPLAQVYGVATFYSQFRLHPVGRHIVRVCHGTACHVQGAKEISEAVEGTLGVQTGETTADRQFTLEMVSCIGCCSLAPVIMIDNDTYGNLKPADVKKIVKPYRDASAEAVKK